MNNGCDYTGKKFGMITIISKGDKGNDGRFKWWGQCDCGSPLKQYKISDLKRKTHSCGCLQKYRMKNDNPAITKYADIKNNHNFNNLYRIHHYMKNRCLNPNYSRYKDYGGRGIDISPTFMDFRKFYEWSISNGYQNGLQIDRINNNLGYSETNCRWVTPKINMRNKRDNRMIKAFGQTKTLSEWCEIFNMGSKTITHRIDKQGMAPEIALSTKTRKGHYPYIPIEYQNSIIH